MVRTDLGWLRLVVGCVFGSSANACHGFGSGLGDAELPVNMACWSSHTVPSIFSLGCETTS